MSAHPMAVANLAARLEKLERQNWLLTCAGAVLLILAGLFFLDISLTRLHPVAAFSACTPGSTHSGLPAAGIAGCVAPATDDRGAACRDAGTEWIHHFGEALNVTDAPFNARADNSTDDGPAFQRAHNALPATGGMIYVPQGNKYAIATKVTITKPVRLVGAGWGSVIRANADITAIFEVNAGGDGSIFEHLRLDGSKSGSGGAVQRGIYFNGAKDGMVRNVLFSGPNRTTGFNFGVDVNGVNSGRTWIVNNRFERLVSSSGNGTAILIEASHFNHVLQNVIDGEQFNNADGAPGAAIFLSAAIGGAGSVDNVIAYNRVHDHKQAGMGVNSTTYFEFSGKLGACDRNVFAYNDIYNCFSANGGDASSGIVLTGNSNHNRVIGNKVHHNGHTSGGGHGIVLSGSRQGMPRPGQPKLDESPSYNELIGNDVYSNKDQGIRIKGANSTIVRQNRLYANGQRAANTFQNLYLTTVGGTSTASNSQILDNVFLGEQPNYQVEIGAGISNVVVAGNYLPTAATGNIVNGGAATVWGPNLTANGAEFFGTMRLGTSSRLIQASSGSPEGVVTASVGSLYLRTDGGATTTLYIKESGTGNTGWAAK